MHFSTIKHKKAFRKKNQSEEAPLQKPSAELRQAKRKKITRITFSLAFLFFFILLLTSLRTFGNDNYYTIKRDEDLDKIARKFNVPQKILLTLNDMTDPSEIQEGMRIQIPYAYDICTVKPGDTLYKIAEENGIKLYELASHNKYKDSGTLKAGDLIHIPRVLSDIKIGCSKTTGLKPFKVEFSVVTNTRGKVKKYLWDLGDNTYSSKKAPVHIYHEKGIYKVRLNIVDENNNEIESNIITLNIRALANISFTETEFFEVNPGDLINLNARAIDNLGDPVEFDYEAAIIGSPKLIEQIGRSDKFKVLKPVKSNYTSLKIECEGYIHNGNYFVSPIPSKHVTRPDILWYRTQFKTGLNGNCGPASAAMAIIWSTGKEVDVSVIRRIIGLPYDSGAVGFNHIIQSLERYRVKSKYNRIDSPQDFFDIIDRGNIAIVLFDMGKIEQVKGNKATDLFGSYYTESGGHYAILKGYSLDKKYLVINDPMPSDWRWNAVRYDDEISMIGRNRYYLVSSISNSLKVSNVLEILH